MFIIPPLLIFIPPVIDASPELTVRRPLILCAVVKLLFWHLYATFVRLPVVLIFVPFKVNPVTAFTVSPVTVPEAVMSTAPAIVPAFVMPPLLLLIPPEILVPALAVNNPFEVNVPAAEIEAVPVVTKLPLVVRFPSSSIVNFVTPPDCTRSALPVDPAVISFIMNEGAVPPFVNVNEVWVARLEPNVKSIFRPVEVVIVLPVSYAACSVPATAEQVEISFEAFLHNVVAPALPRVGTLVILFRIIAPVPFGDNVKSSFVPVVISVLTALNVSVPVVVIAPEATVPILTRFPEVSILSVPEV